jgi:hypothetical protein
METQSSIHTDEHKDMRDIIKLRVVGENEIL